MSNGILIDALTEKQDLVDNLEDELESEDPKDEDGFKMPDKLKGKSAEEIAKMYVEDERYKGDLQNQLGEYRQMTDRLLGLEEKRVSDLEKGGANVDDFDIDPTELLANPKEVMDRYYEQRRSQDDGYSKLQERLDRIEMQSQEQLFQEKHPDVQQIVNDPEFVGWINAHPVRAQLAQTAVQNNDYNSLDYLLSDYKGSSTPQAQDQKAQELTRAAKATTEKASSGGKSSGGTSKDVYSRREIVNLKINNPMEYRQRADEFMRAYAEGRVKD